MDINEVTATPAHRPFAKVHTAKTLSGPWFHLVKHNTRRTLCDRFIDVPADITDNYPGTTISDVNCPRCTKALDRMIEAGEI